MYQPLRCVASAVVRRADKLHLAAACWSKGVYQMRPSIGITIRGEDGISFNVNNFDKDNFSISGILAIVIVTTDARNKFAG